MCGIVGFFDKSGALDEALVKQMTKSLHHRGPDSCGDYFIKDPNYSLGLGHTRLSILDLSDHGHQPMSVEDLTLVYNGEIYNFLEIRADLENLGHKFKSNSDTEVLLKAFSQWGIDCIPKLNGMFAFAIFNKSIGKLWLVRDRAGVKPLYYSFKNDCLIFSSELKTFLQSDLVSKDLDYEALSDYFGKGYVSQPRSIIRDVKKLSAANVLEFDLTKSTFELNQYWDVNKLYTKPKLLKSYQTILSETEDLLISSCSLRLVSDVPVGIFLSGGYDSSVVAGILQKYSAQPLKTFTIGFHDEDYDESRFAEHIAEHLGTEHHTYMCDINDAKDIIPIIPDIWDEPISDKSIIPTYLVCQFASRHVKVAISADGGDELFAGYTKYLVAKTLFEKLKYVPFKQTLLKVSNFSLSFLARRFRFIRLSSLSYFVNLLGADSPVDVMSKMETIFTNSELSFLLRPSSQNSDAVSISTPKMVRSEHASDLDYMMSRDYESYQMDNILVKVDRASMFNGLEAREPLLDYRLVEYMTDVQSDQKLKCGRLKSILKDISLGYFPARLLDRPKKGFSLPINQWLKNDLSFLLDKYLNEKFLEDQGIFNSSYISDLKVSFLGGNESVFNKVWTLLVFQLWYEKWIISSR